MTISPILYSSDNEHFCTPPPVLNPIYNFDSIGLDPCSNHGSIVNCRARYFAPGANNGIDEDGLKLPWDRTGLNFVNPPYGRKIPEWVNKLISEWKQGARSLLLIPSRTGTKIWQKKIFPTASAICFIEGRLQFWDHRTKAPAKCFSKKKNCLVDAKAPFDSALIYWGKDKTDIDRFKKEMKILGEIR